MTAYLLVNDSNTDDATTNDNMKVRTAGKVWPDFASFYFLAAWLSAKVDFSVAWLSTSRSEPVNMSKRLTNDTVS